MADIFAAYENEFVALKTSLGRVFDSLPRESGERRKVTLIKVDRDIQELETILQTMDLESRSSQDGLKSARTAKVKELRGEITKIKADYRKAMLAHDQAEARDRLMEEIGVEMTVRSHDGQRIFYRSISFQTCHLCI
eukprot:TRINITY_DN6447_c0_g1_i2.p1 TRINITY_DN6447_c0_g1~~TRINITY_DN6447_c0_g1_i2.p1  ORF type:complete len:137 (-),score=26.36 TRINITY_DN6447_c0_g1_i2:303-713(-)